MVPTPFSIYALISLNVQWSGSREAGNVTSSTRIVVALHVGADSATGGSPGEMSVENV